MHMSAKPAVGSGPPCRFVQPVCFFPGPEASFRLSAGMPHGSAGVLVSRARLTGGKQVGEVGRRSDRRVEAWLDGKSRPYFRSGEAVHGADHHVG